MQDAKLFTPTSFGDLRLKNRFVLAPLTRARSVGRIPNDANRLYYTQRAGFGLLITEATTVSPIANGWSDTPGIYTQEMCDGWKEVVRSVHEAGGVIICQLWFHGRSSHSSFMPDGQIVAPSAIAISDGSTVYAADGTKQEHEVPRALEESEIASIVESYGVAAAFAKEAGFDGIEIHGANGYIIDQFLQSCSNVREDAYGGSIERRFTFLKQVVERCLQVFPAGRVGVRISPNGVYNGQGSADNGEMFRYVAAELNKYSLAFLHVMDGLGFGFHQKCPPVTLADLRPIFTSGALVGNVGYTAEQAEARLQEGTADAIAFGRVTLSNPDFPARVQNGWPLAADCEFQYYYAPTEAIKADPNIGYTTFPAYSPTPRYHLKYWNGRGLMEVPRCLLAVAGKFPGVDYTDGRYTSPEGDLTQNLGRMPVLQVGEEIIGQSAAINHFLASELGLLGASALEAARIVSLAESLKELSAAYRTLVPYGSPAPSEELLDTWFDSGASDVAGPADGANRSQRYLRWWMGRLEACLGSTQGFAVGAKLSLADILIYNMFGEFLTEAEAPDMAPAAREPFYSKARTEAALAQHPKLQAVVNTVRSNANLQRYWSARGVQRF